MSGARSGPGRPERLVNLTDQVVRVRRVDGGWLDLPPSGRVACVEERRLGAGVLAAEDTMVSTSRLRRPDSVRGLPSAQPGVHLVVSRRTALESRRSDLVFPDREVRDDAGRVVGAESLGRFADPQRRALRPRLWRRAPDWLADRTFLPVVFAAATALVGGFVGALPTGLAEADPKGHYWLVTGLLGTGGGLALASGWWGWHEARRRQRDRGTAFVVAEHLWGWAYEERRQTLALLGREYARVVDVPGPSILLDRWEWGVDGAAAGQWNARLEELVTAFRAVQAVDDQTTNNVVVLWMPWALAWALGDRLGHVRGLTVKVTRRSDARGRALDRLDPAVDLADPVRRATTAASHGSREIDLSVTGSDGQPRSSGGAPLKVLLVWMTDQRWGPLSSVDDPTTQPLTVHDPCGLLKDAPGRVTLEWLEWRPRDAPHEWHSYPDLAAVAAEWVSDRLRGVSGTVLVGALFPQEVPFGVGLRVAGTSPGNGTHVWPLIWSRGQFVVPDLSLVSPRARR